MQNTSRFILTLSLLSCFFIAHSQKATEGCLIYTLGPDTVAIGNYSLKGQDFSIRVADLTDGVVVTDVKGTFFSNGEIATAEGSMTKQLPGGASQPLLSYKLYYDSGNTVFETRRGATVSKKKYPVKIMETNILGYAMVYITALEINFAPPKVGDSLLSHHIVFNSARDYILKHTGDKTYTAGSSVMGMFRFFVDAKGNLLSVDGMGTSWNIKGTVVPPVNMDAEISANTAKKPHAPIVNKLDSVQSSIGATAIKIRYSRPSVRGRVIFGNVVPYDRWWRTGADAATKLTISKPLWFEGKILPAGEYSIFTMPTKTGWTIMFNREANIWGTEYKPENDVLRVPMKTEALPATIEFLTYTITADGAASANDAASGGEIEVSWEKVKASVRFNCEGPKN